MVHYDVVVKNDCPSDVTGARTTISIWDGRGRPLTVPAQVEPRHIIAERNPGDCEPRTHVGTGGRLHRATCLTASIASHHSVAFELRLDLGPASERPGFLLEDEINALVASGAVVVRADVKVNERERDGGRKNNHATERTRIVAGK